MRCRFCNRAIERHPDGGSWVHRWVNDFIRCGHLAQPEETEDLPLEMGNDV